MAQPNVIKTPDNQQTGLCLKKDVLELFNGPLSFAGRFAHAFTLPELIDPKISLNDSRDIVLPFQDSQVLSLDGVFNFGASHVDIGNDDWPNLLESTVLPTARSHLGVSDDETLDLKLRNVLVIEPGKGIDNASVGDIPSSDGSFACLLLILPYSAAHISTPYCIHLARLGQVCAFDFAPCLPSSTVAITWYADAQFHLQVQQGHRLALLYSIVSPPPSIAPHFPDIAGATQRFQTVLNQWADASAYGHDQTLLVYPLVYTYTKEHFATGLNNLVTNDKALASILQNMPGIQTCLARLKSTASPYPLGRPQPPRKKKKPSFVPFLDFIVSLNGQAMIPNGIVLDSDEILGAGDHDAPPTPCRVLFIYPKKHEADIMFRSVGPAYAVHKLHTIDTSQPSDEACALVRTASHNPDVISIGKDLLKALSIQWNDPTPWFGTVDFESAQSPHSVIDMLSRFPFERLKRLFNIYVSRVPFLTSFTFFDLLPQRVLGEEKAEVLQWINTQVSKCLQTPRQPNVKDIAMVLHVAHTYGYNTILEQFLPFVQDCKTSFLFWITLYRELISTGPVPTVLKPQQQQIGEFCALIKQILTIAIRVIRLADHSYQPIDRVIEICFECANKKMPVILPELLGSITPNSSTDHQALEIEYRKFYIPLVSRLLQFVAHVKWDPTLGIIGAWFKYVIAVYMNSVFGLPPSNINDMVQAYKIGCASNDDCEELDAFLFNMDMEEITFRVANPRRLHIISRMESAPDLVTYQILKIGIPHRLKIVKRPELIAKQKWEKKRQDAGTFLRLFGLKMLVVLMGEQAVEKMVEPLRPEFVWEEENDGLTKLASPILLPDSAKCLVTVGAKRLRSEDPFQSNGSG